ncbi:MAG: precorrin-4 C(11)-methyltransferase [Alphaproteobacteria bacterium]|nr:precorrin-4 C(11)-methyltransferase [Alphaproteobacteria bacterium]MDA7989002.1 precorrin-4 C(11)-methyltransferase [Alphaproteobacteria bacterium]MDA8010364.1 precorrin-4 C(11)-methyltransferase [Alphaproteobacteria bacterium]
MIVHFIGAGPGDAELITLRGQRLIETCPVILYAGSLVPREVIARARDDARVLDTSAMDLNEIEREFVRARDNDEDVARVHSGDPSLYGAIAEQTRILRRHGIAWKTTPGVPAFAAAAAVLGQELTLPEVAQTVILTRTSSKASPMPEGETLEVLGRSGATLVIHLSARNLRYVVRELAPFYGEDCPAVAAYRVGWGDEEVCRTTLGALHSLVLGKKWTRTVLVMVGRVFAESDDGARSSALYDSGHPHIFRPHARKKPD